MRPTRVVAVLVVLAALASPGCTPKTKVVLTKFDASALTAVQTIAVVEKELASVGKLKPEESLAIRMKLRPVIELGEQATQALLLWQPGQATPAAMLELSVKISDLAMTVTGMLTDGEAKARILEVISLAQSAWAMAIRIMSLNQQPDLTPALVGGAL